MPLAEKRQRPRSLLETKRHLEVRAAGLHPKPVADVDADAIQALLDEVEENSGPVNSNCCRSALGVMFNSAMKRRKAPTNLVALTDPLPENSRERVLSLDELTTLWNSATGDFGDLVKLLMLTGCRRSEIADAALADVDLEAVVLSVPAHRSKNRRPHKVPLSAPAQPILQTPLNRWKAAEEGEGHHQGADARLLHAQPYGRRKAALAEAVGFSDWRLYDLRRSVATHWAEASGVSTEVVEVALNHLSGARSGVTGIYIRAEHWQERVEVAEQWASMLLEEVAKNRGLRLAR